MRIITGKAKGIQLKTLEGIETRPTSERVKEAVFSMIQFDIENRTVLDLFAGSGQMGLEALSRGAANATFIDSSKKAVKIIEENALKTRLSDMCNIKNCDSLDFIKRSREQKFDIVFLDPPYASNLYAPALITLYKNALVKGTSFIVCESNFDTLFNDFPELSDLYEVCKTSKYSQTVITLLKPKM